MENINKTMKEEKRLEDAPHFTEDEIMLLLNLLTKYGQIIEQKSVDANSHRQKQKAWTDLSYEFNNTTKSSIRTLDDLQICYRHLKKVAQRSTKCSYKKRAHSPDLRRENNDPYQKLISGIVEKEYVKLNLSWPKEEKDDVCNRKVKRLVRSTFNDCFNLFYDNTVAESPILSKVLNHRITESYNLHKGDNPESGTIQKVKYFVGAALNDCYKVFEETRNDPTEEKTTGPEAEPTLKNVSDTQLNQLSAAEKFEELLAQRKILKLQLTDEKEKLEHNRIMRLMELKEKEEKYNHERLMFKLEAEDAQKKYEHNEMLRKMQLEKHNN
uniref:Regulatory protein zeste n=1 Tax=Bactrocera latifrons TaxID=174628 RepID=A0A0K8UTU7_BACLA